MIFKQIFKIPRSQFTVFHFGLMVSLLTFSANHLVAANYEDTSQSEVSTTQLRNPRLINTKVNNQDNQTLTSELIADVVELPVSVSQSASQKYLYGQSSQPDQLGQEYLVFEVRQDKVVGAFYMPHSEFACFYGAVDEQQMNLNVVDPYTQETFAYSVPLQSQATLAQTNSQISYSFAPQGYEQIETLSDNDQRILNTCVSAHHPQVR